jgi:signal transduction histidine kinase
MPPEQMREVADTIRGDARAANTELRDVLSALREDSAEPLPTSGSIDDLVEATRAEGQDVRLRWEGIGAGDLESAGSATVVTLVRITRELLTNARKHAPDARLELQIVRDHDDLRMSASNPVPASDAAAGTGLGTGLGLTGVRERVRLLGGTFRADVRDGAQDASRDGEHGDPRDATHVGPPEGTHVGPPERARVGPSGDPLASPQNAQTFEVEVRLPWRTR